jgi:hypothetical protein
LQVYVNIQLFKIKKLKLKNIIPQLYVKINGGGVNLSNYITCMSKISQ